MMDSVSYGMAQDTCPWWETVVWFFTLCSPILLWIMHSATLIDPGEAVAWVVVRSKFMITGFKRQSYLWVDGGEGECRRQRCDFRVQLWSLVAMFQHGWD